MWKDSVARFTTNGLISIHKLRQELITEQYKLQPYNIFIIHEPKTREIVSSHFRDRIAQTSLNDNYLYDKVTKSFIYDNHACQKNKGTDKARNRLKHHIHKHYRKNGTEGYILSCDFSNFFGSTRHSVAKDVIKQNVDDNWALEHIYNIIDSFDHGEDPEVGMGLGSPITQLTQLSLPNEIDHIIKEKYQIKGYVRYMDDLILIHHSKEHLKECLQEIEQMLGEMSMKLHPRKTQIMKLTQGITFLGFKFKMTSSGKVLMIISKENIKRRKRKIRAQKKLYDQGIMPEKSIAESFEGWKAHASKGDNHHAVKNMEKYFRYIFFNNNNNEVIA